MYTGLDICALLWYYAIYSGDFLPTFRNNLLVPFSRFKNPNRLLGFFLGFLTEDTGPIVCTETSGKNYHYTLRNIPEERGSHLLWGGSLKSVIEFALNWFWGLIYVEEWGFSDVWRHISVPIIRRNKSRGYSGAFVQIWQQAGCGSWGLIRR